MSFGFSVGDFVTIGILISDIVRSLQTIGGAASEYQELVCELRGLRSVLDIIAQLKGASHQISTIDGLKLAALNCQFVLDDFRTKLRKYKASLEAGSSKGVLRDGAAKIRWSLMMKKDVQDLRAYLSGHTSSLNMRLSIAGL